MSHIQKKVAEHFFQTQTSEWEKQQVYRCRRNRWKLQEKHKKKNVHRLKIVKRLYIPAVLTILMGVIILFGSTIRSLGEGSFLWSHKEQTRVIGPIVIGVGIVMLLVVVGLESKYTDKELVGDVEPFIHEDFKYERSLSRQASQDTTSSPADRGRSIYSLEDSQTRNFFLPVSESIDEHSSPPERHLDLLEQWTKAMQVNISVSSEGEHISGEARTTDVDVVCNDSICKNIDKLNSAGNSNPDKSQCNGIKLNSSSLVDDNTINKESISITVH